MSGLLRWPLPALLSWAASWAAFSVGRALGLEAAIALAVATLVGAALALLHKARWRRLIVAAGFPLSVLIADRSGSFPAWAWLLPLALLAIVYPRRTWGDAPLFPTPRGALQRLGTLTPLRQGERVLDAGCGLGHGLRELHLAYPAARIEGVEWSGLLALLARWRCPWAEVTRGDMWAQSWQPFGLVYVFQRPETMARVWAKACAELEPSAWLVSLDFEVPGQAPRASLALPRGHSLWIYKPVKTGHMGGLPTGTPADTQGRSVAADKR